MICIRIRNSFPFEWLCTRTRFETEVCSNSEMGYCIQKVDLLVIVNKGQATHPNAPISRKIVWMVCGFLRLHSSFKEEHITNMEVASLRLLKAYSHVKKILAHFFIN